MGDYVRLGELALVKAGACFFWTFWLLVFFDGRYEKKWLRGLITLLLMGALAFDGGLLGFQFMGLQEHCLLCVGVGTALFVLAGLLAWVRKSWLVLCLACAVWCGGFAANSVLLVVPDDPALSDTAFLSWPNATVAGNSTDFPQYHLFFSQHCKHCSQVIANLAVNEASHVHWTFHCLDNGEEDLKRLACVLSANMTAENPFLEILHWESEETVPEETNIPEALREEVAQARAYCIRHHLAGVPRLIVDERPGVRLVLSGANSITAYLRQEGILKRLIHFVGHDEGEGSAEKKAAGNSSDTARE